MKSVDFLRFLLSLEIMIICSIHVYGSIGINEIMANPLGEESLNEWIELYNYGGKTINLSNCKIGDDGKNSTLFGGQYYGEGSLVESGEYAIVTSSETRVYNNFNYSSKAVKIYAEDSLGYYGLKNEGEIIYIYCDEELLELVNYSSVEEGKSYSKINESWTESFPTLGYENLGLLFEEEQCDWKIELEYDQEEFWKTGDLNLKIVAVKETGDKTNIGGNIQILDIYGNIVKEYYPFTGEEATYQKSSTKYNPVISQEEAYIIRANIQTRCEDIDTGDNYVEETIFPKGKELDKESHIEISKVYDLGNDDEAEFGQVIRVRVDIYKGETNKKSINLWVEGKGERVSKQSKVNIEDKYSNNTLVVPIQLFSNCGKEYEYGEYDIIAEGLDEREKLDIEIEGFEESNCGKEKVEVDYEIIEGGGEYKIKIITQIGDKIKEEIEDLDIKLNNAHVDAGSKDTCEIEENQGVYINPKDTNSVTSKEESNIDIIKEDEEKDKKESITGKIVYKSESTLIKENLIFGVFFLFGAAVIFSIMGLNK